MTDKTFLVDSLTEAESNRERIKTIQAEELEQRLAALSNDHFLRAEAKSHRGGWRDIRIGRGRDLPYKQT